VPETIARAIAELQGWPGVDRLRCSSLYRSQPVGPVPDQPWFVNAVIELLIRGGTARELFVRLKGLERALGRRPGLPQGPRVIDLDLLLFAGDHIDSSDLVVPHPRLCQRAFVLAPLAELLGGEAKLAGRPLAEHLAAAPVAAQVIERLAEPVPGRG
jgi:2-amino-4-hydroxy-6-hydroxymethyldihydropteridine diphosphokinase